MVNTATFVFEKHDQAVIQVPRYLGIYSDTDTDTVFAETDNSTFIIDQQHEGISEKHEGVAPYQFTIDDDGNAVTISVDTCEEESAAVRISEEKTAHNTTVEISQSRTVTIADLTFDILLDS